MHYMGLFSRAGNIFRQPRALQASNAMLQGNLSLTPSKIFVGGETLNLLFCLHSSERESFLF